MKSVIRNIQEYSTNGWNSFSEKPGYYLKEIGKDYWDAGASVLVPAVAMMLLKDAPTFSKYSFSLGIGLLPSVIGFLRNDERGLRNGTLDIATVASLSDMPCKELIGLVFLGGAIGEDYLRRKDKKLISKIS